MNPCFAHASGALVAARLKILQLRSIILQRFFTSFQTVQVRSQNSQPDPSTVRSKSDHLERQALSQPQRRAEHAQLRASRRARAPQPIAGMDGGNRAATAARREDALALARRRRGVIMMLSASG